MQFKLQWHKGTAYHRFKGLTVQEVSGVPSHTSEMLNSTLSVFSVFSFKESIDFGISRNNYTLEKQRESSQGRFCCIFPCYQKLMVKPCISHVIKYTIRWESDGRKVSYVREKMGTNFPGSPNWMGFAAFFMLWKTDGETHAFPM